MYETQRGVRTKRQCLLIVIDIVISQFNNSNPKIAFFLYFYTVVTWRGSFSCDYFATSLLAITTIQYDLVLEVEILFIFKPNLWHPDTKMFERINFWDFFLITVQVIGVLKVEYVPLKTILKSNTSTGRLEVCRMKLHHFL